MVELLAEGSNSIWHTNCCKLKPKLFFFLPENGIMVVAVMTVYSMFQEV